MSSTEATTQSRVREFFKIYGQETPTTLDANICSTKKSLLLQKLALIKEEVKELEQAVTENDLPEIIDALGDITYVVYGMAIAMGFDLDYVVKVVHDANLTKLCKSEAEALESIEHYKKTKGFEDVVVKYRPSCIPDCFTLYNAQTDKILKSHKFQQPDFNHMVKDSH